MKQFARTWSAAVRTFALIAAVAVVSVQSAHATTIGAFETDTSYRMEGSIFWGVLGELLFQKTSTLRYDSATKDLVIDAQLITRDRSHVYDLDIQLGQVRNNGGKAEFAFPDGSYNPTGMSPLIGELTPRTNVQVAGRTITGGTDLDVFGIGMPASIHQIGNILAFQGWWKLWGTPIGFDVAADPSFSLHKITPPNNNGGNNGNNNGSEVPEPMTMSLFGMGLAGMAARRKRNA